MKRLLIIFVLLFTNLFSQEIFLLNSNYIPSVDTVYVFTPSQKSDEKLPLVVMLHGYAGNYKQWSEMVNLQKYSDSLKLVIACPDAFFDSYYINSPVRENSQYESFFFEVFLPEVIKTFNVDKSKMFITGLSMGGHGAISFFLKRPDLFVTAASISGLLDLTAFPNRQTIKGAAGDVEDFSSIWAENSCINLLKNIVGKNKSLYIDCGTEDFLYNTNLKFLEKCNELKINVKYKFQPGIHEHAYWKKSVIDHFTYFSSFLN